MEKFLVFTKDVISPDRLVKWFAGSKYKVEYETDDAYMLCAQNKQRCGIGKDSEGIKFEVLEEF